MEAKPAATKQANLHVPFQRRTATTVPQGLDRGLPGAAQLASQHQAWAHLATPKLNRKEPGSTSQQPPEWSFPSWNSPLHQKFFWQ